MRQNKTSYKTRKITHVPERYRFFGDDTERNIEAFITEFEPNTFIVKGMTGCGATTLLLENNQPMILSCPTNELCECKSTSDRHQDEVFWYKQGVTDLEIKNYLLNIDVPKFIVVYDRTHHLYQALKRIEDETVGEKYVLAIDEAHMMMTALSYREKAIRNLTGILNEFDNVQFITATPVPDEFTPDIFKQYNYVEYQWEGAREVEIITSKQKSPIQAVCNFIKRFKIQGSFPVNKGNAELIEAEELIYFINSVKDIATIINTTNLQPEECKIIVAEKYHNTEILAKAFGIDQKELKLSKASDPNKKFTFVTSKAFEGVDFYSETALSVVISNTSSKSTLLDMAVSLPQIAGRIRTIENKLSDTVLFIYNTTSYGQSEEEREEQVEQEIEEAQKCIDIYKRLVSEEEKAVLLKKLDDDINHGFLQRVEQDEKVKINLDNDAIKLRRYQNYISGTYCSQLKVINTIAEKANTRARDNYFEENVVLNQLTKQPFREVVKKYIELRELQESNNITTEENETNEELIVLLEKEYQILPEAYEKLGAKKMQTASNRSEKNLHAELSEYRKLSTLRGSLRDKFELNRFYSNMDIIKLLKPEFYRLKISRSVKAKDIAFFFKVESMRKKNQSTGKMDKGYLIKKTILKTRPSMLTQLKLPLAYQ